MSVRIPPTYAHRIRKAVNKNPSISYNEFLDANEDLKNAFSEASFNKYKKRYGGSCRPYNNESKPKKWVVQTTVWRYPEKEFHADPYKAFKDFLETLTTDKKSKYEMVKIQIEKEGAWEPNYEVRY